MLRETNNFPLHITSLPSFHHATPRTQPFYFFDPLHSSNFLQNWPTRFLSSATWQPWDSRLCTLHGCTQRLTEQCTKFRTVITARKYEQKWEWVIPRRRWGTAHGSSGGVKEHETKKSGRGPAPVEAATRQRSRQAQTTNAQTSKNRTGPSQRTRRRVTRSPTDSRPSPSKGLRAAAALRTPNVPWQCRQGLGRARTLVWDWLTTSTRRRHPANPRSAAASGAPSNRASLAGTQQDSSTTFQIRDLKPAATGAHPNSCIVEQLRDRFKAIALRHERPQPELQRGFEYPRACQGHPKPAVCRRAPSSLP